MALKDPIPSVREIVCGILRDHMPGYAGPIEHYYDLGGDLGFDSLKFYELVGDLEERLGLQVENNDLLCIRTVDDLVRYIEEQKGRK